MDKQFISQQEIEAFTRTAFQKKPYLFESVDVAGLLCWDDINHLLEKDILDYPRIRLANDSNPAIRGYRGFVSYTLSVTGEKSPHVNRYNLLKSLQSGSTLIIDRCQAYFENVRKVTDYLGSQLRCRSTANLYCAWSSTPSFGLHFDNHDVIAVQIEGVKMWDIHAPTHPYPLLSDKSFDFTPPPGEPMMTLKIEPGQAIYLPAGYWHNVRTEGERSLHISFPVIRPRKIDVIKTVLDSLARYPELREPVAFSTSASENASLQTMLTECLKEIDIDLWESAIIQDCLQQRYVKFNLPDIRTRDVRN